MPIYRGDGVPENKYTHIFWRFLDILFKWSLLLGQPKYQIWAQVYLIEAPVSLQTFPEVTSWVIKGKVKLDTFIKWHNLYLAL